MNKNIITEEGLQKILKEFQKFQEEKKYWVAEKQIAATMGDLSENAEYQGAKESIRNIDKQLFKLNSIINNATPASTKDRRKDKIVFGSYVDLLRDDVTLLKIRIVGTNELSYVDEKGYTLISKICPMGQALIGKEVGDEITVLDFDYEIEKID